MENPTSINCPKCGESIDVQNIISHQLEAKIKQKYESEFLEKQSKCDVQLQELNNKKELFEKTKKDTEESFRKKLEEDLAKNLILERTKIKIKIDEEHKGQLEELNKELNEKSEQVKELNKSKAEIEKLKREKNEAEEKARTEAEKKVTQALITERTKIKAKIDEEHKGQLEELNKELNEKSEQVKELNKSKAEIEKLKREKNEAEEFAKIEAEKQLTETLNIERVKIKKSEEEKNELKLKEVHHQLDQQKKLTEEMRRKQEQGSMQLQGEVQELVIEEWLEIKFPLDGIEEIKKGVRGGDCLQTVNTRTQINCGTIYYESKRAKDFQPNWIEKFKTDIREKGADIGVLVTQVMPKDMSRMGIKEGIWICTYEEFKGLCAALRESLVKINTVMQSQENKEDKTNLLYNYLTSNEFKMQIEAIVEGFTEMKNDLDKEKRAMKGIWKRREKQIEKVISNTVNMHSSIKGIGGNSIQEVKALELGYDEEFE